MIILAHDGTIYGDWVSCYALRFAATERDRKLLVLHVQDGAVRPEIVASRFAQLSAACAAADIDCHTQELPPGDSVYRTLRQAIPPEPDALLICGTRVKARRQKYLAGTISENLLRMHQCPVLALRVVQPGLLGNPHDLLLPLAGHLHGFRRIEPILSRLAPHLRTVHICRAMQVNPLRHPHLSRDVEDTLIRKGNHYLTRFRTEMQERLGPVPFRCDQRVAITSDWAHEVMTLASRLKTQLMLLGLSERTLAYRVLHSAGIERILHETPCDVGVYRGL